LVLVVRLSALGDLLFALETVAALKRERPDLRVEFLVEDRFAALLAGHPQLDCVHVYPRRNKLRILTSLMTMRRRRFDAILDLHGILKSAFQVRLLRAGCRVGYARPGAREGSHRFYDVQVAMPTPLPHRADMGHLLLAELGLSGRPAPPALAASQVPRGVLDGLAEPLVVLHPGTSGFAAFKRWPAERFGELAAKLVDRGIGVAVTHGPGEAELAEMVARRAPGVRLVDGGELGLLGLAAILGRASVVVAADTGPLHIAAAMGTRCVAIFGPKDPARYGPRAHDGLQHEVVFHSVPCRPCRRRDCAAPICVLGVDVAQVEQAVQRQLHADAGARR
jgi:lipopolysaccharide heptosyltransferase I